MLIKAPAKVNIGLKIVGTREDGYHLLDMVMQTVELFDELEINLRDDGIVHMTCNIPYIPTDERNLVYKAAKLIAPNQGFDITLKKQIPSQAGMGGGSSDAAATLKAINELLKLNKSESELEEMSVKLGADVPFFIKGGCQRCQGIGEILSPASHGFGKYYVIVKPDFGAKTKDVYKAYDRLEEKPDVSNVLEPVTAAMHPEILEIKQKLSDMGAEFASMTGSGTAVFGIFTRKPCDLSSLPQNYNLYVVEATK